MTRSGVEKQLRDACGDMQNDAYWVEPAFPGLETGKERCLRSGELHQSDQTQEDGWEVTEAQCYAILSRKW